MKPFRFIAFAAGLAMAGAAFGRPDTPPAGDVPGSRDNPVVSRFAGSVIIGYQAADYDRLVLPLGRFGKNGFAATEAAEGRVTRIAYAAPSSKSALEIYRSFQAALAAAGFATRYACQGNDGCGDGYHFAGGVLDPVRDALKSNARNLIVDALYPANGNLDALVAHLARPEGDVDVLLLVAQDDRQVPGVFLEICERKPMAAGEVSVDAKAMSTGLAASGHVALYGLQFETDSVTIEPASRSTLAEMARLLDGQPSLKVYIVGHTDDTGSPEHNLALSRQRAQAVVRALETDYHVAPGRLQAEGVASWAPVASNASDAGRARNRRVELVAQ